jgi:hypothetical protein
LSVQAAPGDLDVGFGTNQRCHSNGNRHVK